MGDTRRGITGYSADRNGDEVFEYKNAKIKSIFLYGGMLTVFVFILFMIRFSSKGKSSERILVELLVIFGVSLLIGLFLGIYRSTKVKYIRIVVGKTDVDVTVGKAHDVYLIEDFLMYNKDYSNGSHIPNYWIIFRDPEGGDDLKIRLPDFPKRLFVKMVDTITFRKADLSGESQEYTPFEGDTYKGAESSSSSTQVLIIFWGMTVFMIFMTALLYVLRFAMHWLSGIKGTILLALVTFFTLFEILLIIFITIKMRKMDYNEIMELTIGEKDLTVNGTEYPYEKILSIHMTSPLLTKVFDEHRILSMDVRGDAGIVNYCAGKRRSPNSTEAAVSEGRSCEYPSLYAKITGLCKDQGIKFIEKDDVDSN